MSYLLLHFAVVSLASSDHDSSRLIGDARFFGVGLAAVGDTNADGTPDFLVADVPPRHHRGCTRNAGGVWILSGRDGAVLTFVKSSDPHHRFGWSTAGVGDVDLDGGADWIVGSNDVHGEEGGFAEVYSGKSGRRVFRVDGPRDFGCSVGGAGDVDGDGRPDVVVAGDVDARTTKREVLATVFSGRDGTPLCVLGRQAENEILVANPLGLGDIDGDGRSELALLVRTHERDAALQLRIHSGRDWAVLRTVFVFFSELPDFMKLDFNRDRFTLSLSIPDRKRSDTHVLVARASGQASLVSARDGRNLVEHPTEDGTMWEIELGAGLACAGDLDGDGVPDLWVGRDSTGPGEGWVLAYSGRDGHVLYMLGDGSSGDVNLNAWHFGAGIVAVGDVDGDGVGDALIGTDHSLSHYPGCAFLFSGKTGRRIFGMQRDGGSVRVSK